MIRSLLGSAQATRLGPENPSKDHQDQWGRKRDRGPKRWVKKLRAKRKAQKVSRKKNRPK